MIAHTSKPLFALCLILTVCVFSGIAKGEEPDLRTGMPSRWTPDRRYDQSLPSDDRWWEIFNDSTLSSLIERGERENFNVAMAARRIEISRRSLQETRAGYFPTLDASAGYDKTRHNPGLYNLGLQMSWEIDLFGRINRESKQGKAAIQASRADYAATMVSLASNIAKTYFDLRMNQMILGVLQRHVHSQEQIVHLTEVRYETGLSSLLDVEQARTVLYTTQSELPQYESQIESDINSLAVLLSLYPSELHNLVEGNDSLPPYAYTVAVGVPADLLRRRPDVVEAEYELAQDAAAVGISKNDYLPMLELNGNIGVSNSGLKNLFKNESFTWEIAPTLSWTVFDGLSRKYKLASAKEQLAIAVDNYNLTVLTAYQEVCNAMASYSSLIDEIGFLEKATESSAESLSLSLDLYKKGLNPFTPDFIIASP